jgi:DNA-binding transcriptional regulator YdaS (Cro superfamily)
MLAEKTHDVLFFGDSNTVLVVLMAKHTDHPLDQAADVLQGRANLAERLGVTPSAIGNWKKRGVPLEYCAAIERLTGAQVTRRHLRPVDWADFWPELAQIETAVEPVAQSESMQ